MEDTRQEVPQISSRAKNSIRLEAVPKNTSSQEKRQRGSQESPICLLSEMYKVFARITLNRISSPLEEQQPKEQAGFRRGYSTINHLFVINQLLERCREYKTPICLVFIDYKKAFDNVGENAVLQALKD